MADFQNAGYRLLSFKYTPPQGDQKQAANDNNQAGQGAQAQAGDAELPSLSSLLTSLREIEAGSDDAGVKNESGAEMQEGSEYRAAVPKTTSLCGFHFFDDLPTELRLKIWDLTFLPRVVELRPTRPNYSPGHDDGRTPQVGQVPSERQSQGHLSLCHAPFPLCARLD